MYCRKLVITKNKSKLTGSEVMTEFSSRGGLSAPRARTCIWYDSHTKRPVNKHPVNKRPVTKRRPVTKHPVT